MSISSPSPLLSRVDINHSSKCCALQYLWPMDDSPFPSFASGKICISFRFWTRHTRRVGKKMLYHPNEVKFSLLSSSPTTAHQEHSTFDNSTGMTTTSRAQAEIMPSDETGSRYVVGLGLPLGRNGHRGFTVDG